MPPHHSPGCRQHRAATSRSRPPMSGNHRSTTGPGQHHVRTSRSRAPKHAAPDDGDEDDLQASPATSELICWPTQRDLAWIELLFRVRDGIRKL
jgi:hypothetical protein